MNSKFKVLTNLFVITLLFFLVGCNTEEMYLKDKGSSNKNGIVSKYLTGQEAKKVVDILKKELRKNENINVSSNNTNSSQMRLNEGEIDFNTILLVLDTLGVKNYSFKIINHPEDNIKTFHNLVVTEKENEFNVTIMKYEMTDLFAQDYYSGLKSFYEFQGKIKAASLAPVDPCFPIEIDYPSNPSSGSDDGGGGSGDVPVYEPGNGSNTGGGGGDISGCTSMHVSFSCSCGRNYGSWASYAGSFCGDGSYPGYILTITVTYSYNVLCRTSSEPCIPDGSIGVINTEDFRNTAIFFQSLSLQQQQWANANSNEYNQLIQHQIDNIWSEESEEFAIEMINFGMERNWKAEIKQAISTGITSSAELTHKMYSKLSAIAINHPSSISYINTVIDGVRAAASTVIDTNPNTCNWTDLFNMWLFELGNNPLNFNGPSVTVTSLQSQQGVSQTRSIALNQIANGNLNTIPPHGWTYGQQAFYNGMANGNIATSFLGSYTTNVTITVLPNGQHMLTFSVTNPSTWDSATRLRIDNDHNDVHDGIFPNHVRNAPNTLHIGGNFNQEWTWSETY
jgi:hypothetical protein